MKRLIFLTIILIQLSHASVAQFQDNVWVFGDSTGLNFNTSPPTPINTGILAYEACSSISDASGNLLFYCGSVDNSYPWYGFKMRVYNANHQLMANGDNVFGCNTYAQGATIVPFVNQPNKYYLITFGRPVGGDTAYFVYSVIDMSLNNGLGAVTQKNVVIEKFHQNSVNGITERIHAVKHANGKDWWLMAQYGDTAGCSFVRYLITEHAIQGPYTQIISPVNIGTIAGILKFNKQGTQMAYSTSTGAAQLFDFDRCTGLLSNAVDLSFVPAQPAGGYYGLEFSNDGSKLYIATFKNLYQFNTQAFVVPFSKTLIFTAPITTYYSAIGQLKRAIDGKIYIAYYESTNGNATFGNVKPDSLNTKLSVINQPDSLGSACNFVFGQIDVYRVTYYGLPNTPNFNLGVLEGSPCDTVGAVGVQAPTLAQPFEIKPLPNHKYQIWINKPTQLTLTDITGRIITQINAENNVEIDLNNYAQGVYLLSATGYKTVKLVR